VDDKGGFDTEMQRVFRALNENAGECPSADVLEAYTRGRLPNSAEPSLRKHLSGCGICELVVERLQALDAQDWYAAEKNIRSGLGITVGSRPAWRRIVWNPAPAYALAAALAISLGIAVRAPVPAPRIERAPQAVIEVPAVLALEPETRGASPVMRSTGLGHADTVVLKFFVPIQRGSSYSATILSASGIKVVSKQAIDSQDGIGNFYLICARRILGPGDYLLRVTESGGMNGPFEFPFSIQ